MGTETQRDDAADVLLKDFVAPWVLPGEEMPLVLEWSPSVAFESASLVLPEGFEVAHTVNIARYTSSNGSVEIQSLEVPGYLGINLLSKKIPDEVLTQCTGRLHLALAGGRHFDREYKFSVVRPKLEVVEWPTTVELLDKAESELQPVSPVVISLRHTGLGAITIEVKATFRGVIISRTEDILRAVLTKIISILPEETGQDSTKEAAQKAAKDHGLDIQIDPMRDDYVAFLYEQLLKISQGETLPAEILGDLNTDEVGKLLLEIDLPTFNRIVNEQVYTIYIQRFLEQIRRYPSDFAEIEGGPPSLAVEAATTSADVKVSYSDVRGNKYPDIEGHIELRDARKKRKPTLVPMVMKVETQLLHKIP